MKRCWAGMTCVALAVLLAMILSSAASAVTRPKTHTHPLVRTRPLTGTQPLKGSPTTSSNWSGYDDSTDGPFTSVTATWTQPRVRNAGLRFTDAAFWVGLDGDNSNTVEQIGTEGYSEGVVGYDAWYEMYPAAPVTIDMSIHPGDVLTGTVTYAAPVSFTLTLVNHTTGKSFSTVQTMMVPPALASAEVIAEAPSSGSGIVPLSNFGLVDFRDCAFNGQPIGTFSWNQIDMVSFSFSTDATATVAATRPLGPDGASFTVASDLTAPTTHVIGAGTAWQNKPVRLYFIAADNPGGTGVAYSEYSLNHGVTWTRRSSVTITAPGDHSKDGAHTVLCRSADAAGNLEVKRACSVYVDTRKPSAEASPASVLRGATAQLRCAVTDAKPCAGWAAVKIWVKSSHGVIVQRLSYAHQRTGSWFLAKFRCALAKGTYRYYVYATDAAGNTQTAVAVNTLVVR